MAVRSRGYATWLGIRCGLWGACKPSSIVGSRSSLLYLRSTSSSTVIHPLHTRYSYCADPTKKLKKKD